MDEASRHQHSNHYGLPMRHAPKSRWISTSLAAAMLLAGCAIQTGDKDTVDDPGRTVTDLPTTDGETTSLVTELHTYKQPVVDVLFIVEVPEGKTALLAIVPAIIENWIYWGIDFQAGATTIDESPEMGRLTRARDKKWVDPSDEQPALLMQELINVVQNEGSYEKGFDATHKALEWTDPGEPNDGFLRPDSQVAVVMLSYNNDAGSQITPMQLSNYLNDLRPKDSQVEFHSITDSADYIFVSNQVGGILWPLFAQPLNPSMQAVTETFDATEFPLEQFPDEATLVVQVTNPGGTAYELTADEFIYAADLNSITIHSDPPPDADAELAITYLPM